MALAGRDSADDEPDDQQHSSDAHYYLREGQAGLDNGLVNGTVPVVPGRGFLAQGTALFGSGSSPDAVLAGLQAEGQACGTDGAGPADCLGCADLVQRSARSRDRENNSGSCLWQAPRDIQPKGPVAASDDSMSKLLEDQGGCGERAARPNGAPSLPACSPAAGAGRLVRGS